MHIRQVFRNITLTLDEAGANWSNVVEINSYHVGLMPQSEALLRVAAEFLVDPYPALTAVGVTELILPEAVVEISCVALLSERGTEDGTTRSPVGCRLAKPPRTERSAKPGARDWYSFEGQDSGRPCSRWRVRCRQNPG